MRAPLAVIGGSGIASFPGLVRVRRETVSTPWGWPSSAVVRGELNGRTLLFLQRHGEGHVIPPHLVNYRANLWALRECGAAAVVATATVGGIAPAFGPGTLAVPDQIIDYTHGREATYATAGAGQVPHVDFTLPYSASLRVALLDAARRCRVAVRDGGTYGATQGPRLETAAEIARMERDGAHLVGMTGMPEAALARELGIDYAAIAIVVNWAAGKGDSAREIRLEAIRAFSDRGMADAVKIIGALGDGDGR